MKDIVEAAKKTPEAISISAFGAGSDDHLAILSMQKENGIKLITVHHKSTADAKTGALGGHLQVLGANISEVAEEAQSRHDPHSRRDGAGALAVPAECADLQGAGLQSGLVGVARHCGARRPAEECAGRS